MDKPKLKLVTDPEEIAKYKKQGKWKEHLPMWYRNKDGSLWVETTTQLERQELYTVVSKCL